MPAPMTYGLQPGIGYSSGNTRPCHVRTVFLSPNRRSCSVQCRDGGRRHRVVEHTHTMPDVGDGSQVQVFSSAAAAAAGSHSICFRSFLCIGLYHRRREREHFGGGEFKNDFAR